MYALVDCNSCYASCEQIFRPDLRNKPVVVLTNNDGCIVARSKEAKAIGIPDLQAYFKLEGFLKQNNVTVFSSNYELYGDISWRVTETLKRFSPDMEVYSIDECFLLLDGIRGNLVDYGSKMKKALWKEVRMPVSVGIAPTKTLAKLANHIAKRSLKCDGVCVMDELPRWHNVMKKIPVNKIWGIGSRIGRRLGDLDIYSVYDLKTQDPKYMRRYFSVNVERTIRELNGQACIELEEMRPDKQMIMSTRSFGKRVYTLPELEKAISQYASRACEKLRKQNSLVKTVSCFIETSRFDEHPYHGSRMTPLLYPSSDTRDVVRALKQLLPKIFIPGLPYAKAGVGLVELAGRTPQQLDCFTEHQTEKSERAMQVMDTINDYAIGHVFLASNGIRQPWCMQRKLKSPSYTTRWQDLPVVKMG